MASLYAQTLTGAVPFAHALTAAPSDWTMFINFTGGKMNGPTGVGVDSTGNVWVASYFGVASEFTPTGAPVFPNGITAGGLSESYGLAIDAQNNVWIPNESSPGNVNGGLGSVTVLNSAGQVISGSTGYSAGGIAYPDAIAIDTNGTVWVADNHDASVTLLSNNGQPLSGATGYTTPNLAFPVAVAIDAAHNGWVANVEDGYVTKVSPDGSQFTSYSCCAGPGGLAVDQRGFVWVADSTGNSIAQIASNGMIVSTGYNDNGASLIRPQGIAIDGSGRVWVTNFRGKSITELAGSADPSPGQILSPPAGWAPDAASSEAMPSPSTQAATCGSPTSSLIPSPRSSDWRLRCRLLSWGRYRPLRRKRFTGLCLFVSLGVRRQFGNPHTLRYNHPEFSVFRVFVISSVEIVPSDSASFAGSRDVGTGDSHKKSCSGGLDSLA